MSRTFVVGTAGHVDHGKSSLVRALTGIDPDRLAEEQVRHLTIDLGFAELKTPAGNRVHLVDVPGHERFIRNMLAGAGGIDAALLTVAADDGPMPQTREHLAILDLLGIEHGIVVLSKADLVDADWLELVTATVGEMLTETNFATAEIVPVSSLTGAGLPELLAALDRTLEPIERSDIRTVPRLPIDRVFSQSGFGVIVTGTLLDASLTVNDRVEILPERLSSRIRGLQTFGEPVDIARPGSRVAVNLSGLETNQLYRGQVLSGPGASPPVLRFDARFQLLGSSERPLRHNDDVIVFTGSSETPGKAALLEGESIESGKTGWIQVRLARPVAIAPGDRFIVRRPSPAETIGGGTILELDPPRHKRSDPMVIERLEQLLAGDPSERLLARLGDRIVPLDELRNGTTAVVIDELTQTRRIRFIGSDGSLVVAAMVYERLVEQVTNIVDGYHLDHPLEAGPSRELLRQETGLGRVEFDALLQDAAGIEEIGPLVRRPDFQIVFDGTQQHIVDQYLITLREAGFQPPLPDDIGLLPELVQAMIALNLIVPVGEGIVFLPEQIANARTRLLDALDGDASITLAEFRDRLGTTRKYAQVLLEYFDRQRVTRRVGDRRVAISVHRSRAEKIE